MNKRTRMSIAAMVAAFAAVVTVGVAGPADAGPARDTSRPVYCC